MEYDLYAMDESFLDHVRPKVALTATGVQHCTWLHSVSGTVQAIVDDPLQKEHAALATLDAQTATAESLLAQLSAYASQPPSKEADAVWAQMQPLLAGLGAQADHLVSPGAASQWLRDTKLPGLAASQVFARRNTAYKQYGDERISDAEPQAQRRHWETEAVAAEQGGDWPAAEHYRRLVAAWYADLSARETAAWEEMPGRTPAQQAERTTKVKEQQDHQAKAKGQLQMAEAAHGRAGDADAIAERTTEAYNQGAKAGADLRRVIETIVDRRLRVWWDHAF